MTTATKPKSTPSSELARLQQVRDKAHAKVREAKRQLEDYAAETERMRADYGQHQPQHPEQYDANSLPKPDTEAARMRAEISKRMNLNPHRADYDAAIKPFHEADVALQDFQRTRVRDRIEEVTGEVDGATVREAWENLRDVLGAYRVELEEVKGIIASTPGLDGQAVGHDARVDEWYDFALGALNSLEQGEIAPAGLSPQGEYKADKHA
jgi:hypothetical protein